MIVRRYVISLAVAIAGLLAVAWADENPRSVHHDKKLIEFGWDIPDTAYMRQHASLMEKTPFDGCIFQAQYATSDGANGSFSWECWGTKSFTRDDLALAIDDVKTAARGRFSHHFLRFNTTPAKLDWFDDYAAVINNCRVAAEFAKESGIPGVLFDIEQYEGQLFNYYDQRHFGTKSWEEYAAQVRQRGRQVMQAFQQGYPGLTVILTYTHCLPYRRAKGDFSKLPQTEYGLLAPFVDGLVDATDSTTTLVDGYEISYGYKTPEDFAQGRQLMTTDVLSFVADAKKYARTVKPGFGIWLDYKYDGKQWDSQKFENNHVTPAEFETAVRAAWNTTDQYVWIYTEAPRWWSKDGKSLTMPAAYDRAVRRAIGRGD